MLLNTLKSTHTYPIPRLLNALPSMAVVMGVLIMQGDRHVVRASGYISPASSTLQGIRSFVCSLGLPLHIGLPYPTYV